MAYYRLEPFGSPIEDARWARFLSFFATTNSKKGKSYSPEDFMPDYGSSGDEPDEMVRKAEQYEELLKGMSGDSDGDSQ